MRENPVDFNYYTSSYLRIIRSYPKQEKYAINYECQFNNIVEIKWFFNKLLKEEEVGGRKVWA